MAGHSVLVRDDDHDNFSWQFLTVKVYHFVSEAGRLHRNDHHPCQFTYVGSSRDGLSTQ